MIPTPPPEAFDLRPTPESKNALARLFEAILTTAAADPAVERAIFEAMSDSLRGHGELMVMLLQARGVKLPVVNAEDRKRSKGRARPLLSGHNAEAWLRRQLEGLGE